MNKVVKVYSAVNIGLTGEIIEIQTDILNGLPTTQIVGLPDSAVDESKERVKAAIKNTGYKYPDSRVIINLAPANIAKSGSGFDLAIALGILASAGHIAAADKKQLFIGELGLDGEIRSATGVLAIVIAAKKHGFKEVFLPKANAEEASLVDGIKKFTPANLTELIAHLAGLTKLTTRKSKNIADKPSEPEVDFSDIAGQPIAKRALEIAAAGGHNVLMHGPPGSGKTLLARALTSILPPLTVDEKIELTNIYGSAGLNKGQIISQRPVRHPHHGASAVALIGGGSNPRPGEVTLAHRGVLFLDEFPEFPRNVLEALRQPLEDGVVTVSRAKNTFIFPAQFILVAAKNPCPCGNSGSENLVCSCTAAQVQRYSTKISGPLLDRIDLHIEVPRLPYNEYSKPTNTDSSKTIRNKVIQARKLQHARFKGSKVNAHMKSKELKLLCVLGSESEKILALSADTHHLSGRAIHRILKVARTIADLAGSETIETHHLTEALSFRPKPVS